MTCNEKIDSIKIHEQQEENGRQTQTKKIITKQLINYWDGFILFNPGIGHDNLKKSWMSTLKFMLKTKKFILTTAQF
jgi:hypothetical protein